jgi:hypothetical protein
MDIRQALMAEHSNLMNELRLIVKKHLPHATAAFQKRARDIL